MREIEICIYASAEDLQTREPWISLRAEPTDYAVGDETSAVCVVGTGVRVSARLEHDTCCHREYCLRLAWRDDGGREHWVVLGCQPREEE